MSDKSSGDIILESDGWADPAFEAYRPAIMAAASAARTYVAGHGTLALVLSNDAEVRALNRDFRGMDKPTNVLSFPAAPMASAAPGQPPHMGDIILAYETVSREAAAQGKSIAHHAAHLIVHGTLHLAGFDHETERDATEMEQAEREILGGLGIADPYLIDETLE